MASIDMELKRAFAEMQVNKLESSKKLRLIELQTDALKKSKIRFDITDKEISNLDDNTKVYSSIGRMFSLSSVSHISGDLKSKQNKFDELIKQCDTNKEYLIKNLKEQENNLRELVQARKENEPK